MTFLRGLVAVLTVIGCSDSTPPVLVATIPESPGEHCAEGGTAVVSGFDDNGNGILDPSEVTNTAYVCSDGGRSLITVVPELPGANCPTGGQAINVGVDLNANGVLDAD
jgi:hypothetical protein